MRKVNLLNGGFGYYIKPWVFKKIKNKQELKRVILDSSEGFKIALSEESKSLVFGRRGMGGGMGA